MESNTQESTTLEQNIRKFETDNYFHTTNLVFGIVEKHGVPVLGGDFVALSKRELLDAVREELGYVFTHAYIWKLIETNYSGAFFINNDGDEMIVELQTMLPRNLRTRS